MMTKSDHFSDDSSTVYSSESEVASPSVKARAPAASRGLKPARNRLPKFLLKLLLVLKKISAYDGLNRLYKRRYFDTMKDAGRICQHTANVLLWTEAPIYFFTFLDILKLKSLYTYRLHYDRELVSHLGRRPYPPLKLMIKTAKVAERNFFLAYYIPAVVLIRLGVSFGLFPYDTSWFKYKDESKNPKENLFTVISQVKSVLKQKLGMESPAAPVEATKEVEVQAQKEDSEIVPSLTLGRFMKEFSIIVVLADFGFYFVHRLLHTPFFYLNHHKKHHEFKYSIALADHYMTLTEAIMFMPPQMVPPILMWLTGHKPHILSMWAGMWFSQLNGIMGHAGWRIPLIPDWFPFFKPEYHDFHHVDYMANFGANFPAVDMLFGTYVKAGLEKDPKKIMAFKIKKKKF